MRHGSISGPNTYVAYEKESPRAAARGLFILTKIACVAKGCRSTRNRYSAPRSYFSFLLFLARRFHRRRFFWGLRAGSVSPLGVRHELNIARVEGELLVLALEVELKRLPPRHRRRARDDGVNGYVGIRQPCHEDAETRGIADVFHLGIALGGIGFGHGPYCHARDGMRERLIRRLRGRDLLSADVHRALDFLITRRILDLLDLLEDRGVDLVPMVAGIIDGNQLEGGDEVARRTGVIDDLIQHVVVDAWAL